MATQPTSQNQVAFDYDITKANYMAHIKKCFDDDSTHCESTIQKTIEILKGPVKTHLHKNYQVSYAFGREILIEKAKSATDPEVQVLTFEDVFDIFIKYHIGNQHNGGRRHLLQVEKNLNCRYDYPSVCLALLVKSCNVCKNKSLGSTMSFNKTSSVYVTVMIQKRKLPVFRYLLIYIDKATDFVLLRPLKQKSDIEVSMEIFKIMMQFGPPQKLCLHGYNSDFNKRISVLLRQVCPMFYFSIEYKSANFDPSAYVVDKLQEWMTRNSSMTWEIGCSVVQKELNMELKQKIRTEGSMHLSPHELFFGKMNTAPDSTNAGKIPKKGIISGTYMNKISKTFTPQSIIDDVVELRIPSPDNYNPDLLSQFEGSENSQELDFLSDTTKDGEIAILESEIERESIGILNDINMSIVRIVDKSEDILMRADRKELMEDSSRINTAKVETGGNVKCCKDKKKRERKQNLRPFLMTDDDALITLVLECEPDKPVTERKMSLRSAKKVDYTKKTTHETDEDVEIIAEFKMDEEMVYNPDDVDFGDAIDPLDVDEEMTT